MILVTLGVLVVSMYCAAVAATKNYSIPKCSGSSITVEWVTLYQLGVIFIFGSHRAVEIALTAATVKDLCSNKVCRGIKSTHW